ncbi:hypothetical protein FRC17_004326 [Serendipita sp. 399]|nr:hypothetical protein FRC17_004326 [Serendipita sp. 399]
MAGAHAQISDAFPQGNGTDLCLLTNDSVHFYFHRFLLSYTSPVFREMIESGNYSLSQPIHVEEESGTLDLLLRHLDPTKVTPNLDPETIFELLKASKKYQIATIAQWFNNQLTIQDDSNNREVGIVIRNQPMRLLIIGEQLDLPQVSRIALRQLVKANWCNLFGIHDESISPRMWQHLIFLRMERSKFVSEILSKFLLKALEAQEFSNDEHRRRCHTNDLIRRLIAFVGIMATEEPSWKNFKKVVAGVSSVTYKPQTAAQPPFICPLCGDISTLLHGLDSLSVTRGTYCEDIYIAPLADGRDPKEPIQMNDDYYFARYADIERTIQEKELELPGLPVIIRHLPLSPLAPLIKPSNPFTAF